MAGYSSAVRKGGWSFGWGQRDGGGSLLGVLRRGLEGVVELVVKWGLVRSMGYARGMWDVETGAGGGRCGGDRGCGCGGDWRMCGCGVLVAVSCFRWTNCQRWGYEAVEVGV